MPADSRAIGFLYSSQSLQMMLRTNRADKDRLQPGLAVLVQKNRCLCIFDDVSMIQHQHTVGNLVQVIGYMR